MKLGLQLTWTCIKFSAVVISIPDRCSKVITASPGDWNRSLWWWHEAEVSFLPVYIAEHSELLYVVCLMEFLSSFLHRIHLTVSWITECRFFASKTGNTMNEKVKRFKCGGKSARSSGLGHVLHVRLHVWSPQKQSRWHSLCCEPDASKMGDINPPPPSVLPPPPTPGITVHCIWIYIFRYLKSDQVCLYCKNKLMSKIWEIWFAFFILCARVFAGSQFVDR